MIRLDPDSIRRIAVLRANGLGDFLFATPALRALAAGFPRAELTYLGLPWMRPFVEGRYRYIHQTRVVPPYPGLRRAEGDQRAADAEAADFFRWCQEYRFDLAIQMHGGGVESNPFVRRLGARHSLGLAGRGVIHLDQNLTYQFYQSEVMRYLELVGQLGVPADGLDMDAPELPDDEPRLRLSWPDLEPGGYVVVHPGASDPRRHWPIERFAAVSDYVQQAHGCPVVVTGSLVERRLARELARRTAEPVVDLTGQLDLGALLALVRRARLVVGNDTGLAHLAYASGTPSVVVYWCGNLITAGPMKRERFRPVLSWTLDCPACGRRDCRCRVSFVAEAPLEEVLTQVDDLLEGDPGDGRPTVPECAIM